MSCIRLESSKTESGKLAFEHGKFKSKITVVCSKVSGTGNRPPTAKETMKSRESNCE